MTVSGEQRQSTLALSLARTVEAPAQGRAAIAGLSADLDLDPRLRQTLLLLVSEVVSNAVLHSSAAADAEIRLEAAVRDDAVRITVTDGGEGFVPGPRDPNRIEGGYGLFLVAKAASRWEVQPGAPTRVWFELDLDGSPPERA
jgi:anti-sigma regulatory factor (Ser/Thr protein kinase)